MGLKPQVMSISIAGVQCTSVEDVEQGQKVINHVNVPQLKSAWPTFLADAITRQHNSAGELLKLSALRNWNVNYLPIEIDDLLTPYNIPPLVLRPIAYHT